MNLPSFGGPILICGSSGSGKSTLANQIIDAIAGQGYQFCIVDPEGDYARWFQDRIKDEKLAAEAERVAGLADQEAAASRSLIVTAI